MSRAVLITGASRGIGRAAARAFAASGDRVAVHHRDSADLAAQTLAGMAGSGHVVVRGDAGDPAAVQAFVDEAADALGGLDVVVNNAAVFPEHPIRKIDYAGWQRAWRETIEVNLIGAANVIFCAVPHMRAGGRIVNVSSRGAFRGEPDHPAYGASKAGLNALSQSMALALGPLGISVTAVAPGFVETDMGNAELKTPRGPAIRAQSPFNRVATPDEVAAAVHWLASPAAEWATGAVLTIDGGLGLGVTNA
jgi:NAD(P)-dependent dehydrogenase (short-subunit alcohol dehydrogenase family)